MELVLIREKKLHTLVPGLPAYLLNRYYVSFALSAGAVRGTGTDPSVIAPVF